MFNADCHMSCVMCRPILRTTGNLYCMLRCNVNVNVMIVSCMFCFCLYSWSFLFNSERGLWYDGRCGWFKNFESARHFRIESNRNRPIRIRILKIRRSLLVLMVGWYYIAVTHRPPHSSVHHWRSSIPGRQLPCLEQSATARYVCTLTGAVDSKISNQPVTFESNRIGIVRLEFEF